MIKQFTFLFVFILLGGFNAKSQSTIHIISVPSSTPINDTLYLAGNINSWNPGHKLYGFTKDWQNQYWLTIDSIHYPLEFKVTRGSWGMVESKRDGSYLPNRNCSLGPGDTLHIAVDWWEDNNKNGNGANTSTANNQVSIFDSNMYIPQLDRHRKIWVYLPQSYDSSNKSFPVLYMLDGQNVFDGSTSFSGEWKVDETLTQLENNGIETCIVVAINNGGKHRLNEYTSYTHQKYGGGEGDAFLEFITHTLKPRIDSAFRTVPDAKNTGIMGSSLGGLFAHYAHFKYPDVFGLAGAFSPSYWFSEEYFTFTRKQHKPDYSRIYLLAGLQEGDTAKYAHRMEDLLVEKGYLYKQMKTSYPADGEHSEWFWAREFEEAFLWLYYKE